MLCLCFVIPDDTRTLVYLDCASIGVVIAVDGERRLRNSRGGGHFEVILRSVGGHPDVKLN